MRGIMYSFFCSEHDLGGFHCQNDIVNEEGKFGIIKLHAGVIKEKVLVLYNCCPSMKDISIVHFPSLSELLVRKMVIKKTGSVIRTGHDNYFNGAL